MRLRQAGPTGNSYVVSSYNPLLQPPLTYTHTARVPLGPRRTDRRQARLRRTSTPLPHSSHNILTFTQNTPRPGGRSVIACKARVERLVKTLKDDLEALRAGQPIADGDNNTPKKKTAAGTPRKRKAKGEGAEGVNGTPTKRGRKKKAEVEAEVEIGADDDDVEEKFQVKTEPKEEEDVDVEV